MKTLFFYLALLLALGLPACQDAIDLQPQQSIDAATALDSPEKVGSAVVGIYGRLTDANLYGTSLVLLPELMGGDNYLSYSTGVLPDLVQVATRRGLTSANTFAEATWRRAYQVINQANLVLGALPVVPNARQAAQYEGEARFLRALVYFELVRLYAPPYQAGATNAQAGVPLTLSGSLTLEQASAALPRASVADVYAQLLQDLSTAQAKLPTTNGVRATRYAALALLARVHLQQGNYSAARSAADEVIRRSGRSLASTVGAVFTTRNSVESLFELQLNEQNNATATGLSLADLYSSVPGYGTGEVEVIGSFAARYDLADARGTDSLPASATRQLIYLGDGRRPGTLHSLKWRTDDQNVPLFRLAEQYLIRAEADVRAGNTAAALADVNLLRQRSGAPVLGSITLADVLRERQLELAFEGFHLHDLKRTGTDIVTTGGTVVPIATPRLTLPIPQHDLNLNPLLTQNPGY